MLFDSIAYILFLVLVVLIHWRLRRRAQNLFLLGASYFFYGWWDKRFLLLMATSTLADYAIARSIEGSESRHKRKALLICSLVLNFSFLGFFKYFNFFIDSFSHVLNRVGMHNIPVTLLRIILPPGISFYTFQEVAYIVDVYKGRLKASKSILDYALFISLFPHLIAGPIQRPSHLLPQVQHERRFDESKFFDGVLLILSGLFRKCVVADNCALLANAVFAAQFGRPNLFTVLIGTYAFAWQIYGDFSGYSDIARGSAQLLGFHFMVNFRQPYLATSMQDFWRRWHISLSTWLRDYLYIPLGGSRHGERKTYRNLMLTMLLGGLWHGANWTFVAWGAIHGGALAVERYARSFLGLSKDADVSAARGSGWVHSQKASVTADEPNLFSIKVWLQRIVLFHLVCGAWILFRAGSLAEAGALFRGIGNLHWDPHYLTVFEFLAAFSLPLFLLDIGLEHSGQEYVFQQRSPVFRTGWAMAMIVLLAFFTANQASAFIYFQF
jgi:alginate O-acetyltransferase complex protein AlgI